KKRSRCIEHLARFKLLDFEFRVFRSPALILRNVTAAEKEFLQAHGSSSAKGSSRKRLDSPIVGYESTNRHGPGVSSHCFTAKSKVKCFPIESAAAFVTLTNSSVKLSK